MKEPGDNRMAAFIVFTRERRQGPAGHAPAVRVDGSRDLPFGELAGVAPGADAGESIHPLFRLGDRTFSSSHAGLCGSDRSRRDRPRMATYPGATLF